MTSTTKQRRRVSFLTPSLRQSEYVAYTATTSQKKKPFNQQDLQVMLKSHFNLNREEPEEAEPEPEERKVPIKAIKIVTHDEPVEELETPRVLEKSEISVRLSWLGQTPEGEGYAYLKATCTDMKLNIISNIKCFRHLQFVDFSNNFIDSKGLRPVFDLPFLILLQADNNKITSAAYRRCKYLQVLILNNNELKAVDDVYQPELSTLEVGYNRITELVLKYRMPNMKCLDFRYNLIREFPDDMNYPNLDSLYLAGNKIKSLIGIDTLVNLRILHLRGNPIRVLDGFVPEHTKLKYINLRNCKVPTLRQVKKLQVLPALEVLVLKGTPYLGGTGKEEDDKNTEEEDPQLRIDVLAALPRLKRLNKEEYTPEEMEEAKELMQQWLEAGEDAAEEEQAPEEEMEPEQLDEGALGPE